MDHVDLAIEVIKKRYNVIEEEYITFQQVRDQYPFYATFDEQFQRLVCSFNEDEPVLVTNVSREFMERIDRSTQKLEMELIVMELFDIILTMNIDVYKELGEMSTERENQIREEYYRACNDEGGLPVKEAIQQVIDSLFDEKGRRHYIS